MPSKQTLLLCTASAVVAAATLWLLWPRHPKVSREALLVSIRRLREECAAIYADVGASVGRSGARKHLATSSFSSFAAVAAAGQGAGDAGDSLEEEDGTHKLQQVLEQPLILEAALHEANARVAAELFPGGTAEDLNYELLRNGDDEEVQTSMEAIMEMHQACLRGDRAAATEGRAAREAWSQDEVLAMLRRLGDAKVACLETLRLGLSGQNDCSAIADLGAKSIQACVEAEDDVWRQSCEAAGDLAAARRCMFAVALDSHSEDRAFRNRRAAVESELAKATAEVGRGLVSRLSVA